MTAADAREGDARHGWLARQIGTLALSHVQTLHALAPVRSAAWHNALGRLGLHLPLFIVHDLGSLLTSPRVGASSLSSGHLGPAGGGAGVVIGPRTLTLDRLRLSTEARALLGQYQSVLEGIAASEVVEKASSWRLRDELVTVLLARILGDLYARWSDPTKAIGAAPLPLDPGSLSTSSPDELARNFSAFDPAWLIGFLRFVVESRLQLYTAVEQIDLDTLRLLGVLGTGAAASGALELVDLYAVFKNPEASDVVHFSLELLPSVLETKRASGAQAFAVDGYASIERKGSPDSMLLTEFAWDAEHFERKVADGELYYYGRERQREEKRRLQYILVDSSPSMRGVRQVFARGLALALSKKLTLQGDEVWLRFFDSRLYDTQKPSASPLSFVPYLLCFRSERGRHYGKVFRQFLVELTRLRREERRQVVVYIITHGQCHLPVELVEQMGRQAHLYGIFMLPSSEVRLEYLDALDHHQIVDAESMSSREGRKARALDILADAGKR